MTSETNINITVDSNSPPVNYLMTAANTPILYQIILGWWRLHTGFQSILANRTFPWAQWGRKHPHVPIPSCKLHNSKADLSSPQAHTNFSMKTEKKGKTNQEGQPMGKEETNYVVQNILSENILSESTRAYEELRKLAAQKTWAKGPKID